MTQKNIEAFLYRFAVRQLSINFTKHTAELNTNDLREIPIGISSVARTFESSLRRSYSY